MLHALAKTKDFPKRAEDLWSSDAGRETEETLIAGAMARLAMQEREKKGGRKRKERVILREE